MNMHEEKAQSIQNESRRKIYLKAACFALPPVLAAQFFNLFLLPKLTYLQADVGLSDAQIYGTMNLARFMAQYGVTILFALMVAALILEWRVRLWARYRKTALAASVFVVNTTVLLELTSVILAAVLMVPALVGK